MKFAANLNLKEHQFFLLTLYMAENSDNAMARRLTDAIGRAIAETSNAGEVNKSLKSNQM